MSFISFFNTCTVKREIEWWPVYSCLFICLYLLIIVKVFVFITSTIYVSIDHTCINYCWITYTIIHRNKGLASVVSVYTHGYVIAVWGLLGAEKENESCIFFKKSVRANGDLIDSVLGNFGGEQSSSWSFLWAVKWGNYRYFWFWERVFRVWVFFSLQLFRVGWYAIDWHEIWSLRFYTSWNDFHANF